MVFVRKSPGRSGATKVQIAERRDGRDVVLEHVGTAHGEAELSALMSVARSKLYPGQCQLDLGSGAGDTSAGQAVITGKTSAVLWQVLTSAYARLGFDALADDAFAQLVMARIVGPTSKADSVRVLDELGVSHASLRTMLRSLQRAHERDYRSTVEECCFAHAATDGDLSLCMYDVTTLYFEAEHEDALRKVDAPKREDLEPQRQTVRVRP